jgi:hypothetical protein
MQSTAREPEVRGGEPRRADPPRRPFARRIDCEERRSAQPGGSRRGALRDPAEWERSRRPRPGD